MGKRKPANRKNPNKTKDFKRLKRKVGRKAPLKTNETKTSFKYRQVHVGTQSIMEEKGDKVTARKLNIDDLFTKLKHYSSSNRRAGFDGLRELNETHPEVIQTRLSQVLIVIFQGLSDTANSTREAALLALEDVLPDVDLAHFSPMVALTSAQIRSALTHMDHGIQNSAVSGLKLLLEALPESMGTHAVEIASSLLPIISPSSFTRAQNSGSQTPSSVIGSGHAAQQKQKEKQHQDINHLRFDALKCVFALLQYSRWSSGSRSSLNVSNHSSSNKLYEGFSKKLLMMPQPSEDNVVKKYENDQAKMAASAVWTAKNDPVLFQNRLVESLSLMWKEEFLDAEEKGGEIRGMGRLERLGVIVATVKLIATVVNSGELSHSHEESWHGLCNRILRTFPVRVRGGSGQRGQDQQKLGHMVNLSICQLLIKLLRCNQAAIEASDSRFLQSLLQVNVKAVEFLHASLSEAIPSGSTPSKSQAITGELRTLKELIPWIDEELRLEIVEKATQFYTAEVKNRTARHAAAELFQTLLEPPNGEYWLSTPNSLGHLWLSAFLTHVGEAHTHEVALEIAQIFSRTIRLYASSTPLRKPELLGSILDFLQDAKALSAEIHRELLSSLYYLAPLDKKDLEALCSYVRNPDLLISQRLFVVGVIRAIHSSSSSFTNEAFLTFLVSSLLPTPEGPFKPRIQRRTFVTNGSRHLSAIPQPLIHIEEALCQLLGKFCSLSKRDSERALVGFETVFVLFRDALRYSHGKILSKVLLDAVPSAMAQYLLMAGKSKEISGVDVGIGELAKVIDFELGLFGDIKPCTLLPRTLSVVAKEITAVKHHGVYGPKLLSLLITKAMLSDEIESCNSEFEAALQNIEESARKISPWFGSDAERLAVDARLAKRKLG